MEIKLNKDLQKMQDNVVFGLNMRQAVFSGIGLIIGAVTYFSTTHNGLNADIASLICLVVVAPFAALGFVNYHGMPFEKIVCVIIQQVFLCPKVLVFRLENAMYQVDKAKIEKAQEMEAKRSD